MGNTQEINSKPLCIRCNSRFVSLKRLQSNHKICGHCASEIRTNLACKGKNKKTKETIYTIKPCGYCKKEFEGDGRTHYCCAEHAELARLDYNNNYYKKYNQKRRDKRNIVITKTCPECNEDFNTRKKNQVTCSDRCKTDRLNRKAREYYYKKKNGEKKL